MERESSPRRFAGIMDFIISHRVRRAQLAKLATLTSELGYRLSAFGQTSVSQIVAAIAASGFAGEGIARNYAYRNGNLPPGGARGYMRATSQR